MSLLSIVQNACNEVGFPSPSAVVGNSDAAQYLALVNREGESLSRHPWQNLIKEHTFTLVTSDQDYALPTDYRYLIPSTQWNRSSKRRVIWITSEEWQFHKGWTSVNGLNLRARIRNNEFEFEQTIAAGDNGKTIAFEYVSKYWTETSGGTEQQKFAADTDVGRVDEELLTLGLIWRFKKAKGLPYADDFGEYSKQLRLLKSRDGGARKINFGRPPDAILGVNTQEGDYPAS